MGGGRCKTFQGRVEKIGGGGGAKPEALVSDDARNTAQPVREGGREGGTEGEGEGGREGGRGVGGNSERVTRTIGSRDSVGTMRSVGGHCRAVQDSVGTV